MLTPERQNRILQYLQEQKTVTVSELTKRFEASESTIRRDLTYLHELGKLCKVHGGATLMEHEFTNQEVDVATKYNLNVKEKERIAKYATTLIHRDDFIYIDAGTTTERMIDYITNTGAIFVTNGIVHVKKLVNKGCKAYIIGGELKLSTEAIVGAEAINQLKKYNFTKAFIGTNGIGIEQGFTTPDMEEALMKQEAVKRSHMAYILSDYTKFGKVSSVTFASLDQACIITDQIVDDKYKEKTIIKEVTL